ncbi:hypothetical protein GCM10010254_16600 [Streptomyces chromofuscus]|nr:hypothetical protein GCM10010254_16600 [Streptomyces chromofuscus]
MGLYGDDMSTGAPFPSTESRHTTTVDGAGAPVRKDPIRSADPRVEEDAAVHDERLPGDPVGLLGGEERGGAADV